MVDSDVGSKRHSEKFDMGLHIMSPIHSLFYFGCWLYFIYRIGNTNMWCISV